MTTPTKHRVLPSQIVGELDGELIFTKWFMVPVEQVEILDPND